MKTGAEIVVPRSPFPDQDRTLWPMEVTFDGGARSIGDRPKVAGAGETIWMHDPDGGLPVRIASSVVAIPSSDNAQLAEATGCRAGLGALARSTPDIRAARIVGDNLAAIRYGAGTGRYRRLPLATQVELGLRPLVETGWALTWQAVHRWLNVASDRLATLGVFWADALRSAGHTALQSWIVWHRDPVTSIPLPSLFPGQGSNNLDPGLVAETAARLEAAAVRETRASRAAGRS